MITIQYGFILQEGLGNFIDIGCLASSILFNLIHYQNTMDWTNKYNTVQKCNLPSKQK